MPSNLPRDRPFRSALATPPMRRLPGQNHLEPPQNDIPSRPGFQNAFVRFGLTTCPSPKLL